MSLKIIIKHLPKHPPKILWKYNEKMSHLKSVPNSIFNDYLSHQTSYHSHIPLIVQWTLKMKNSINFEKINRNKSFRFRRLLREKNVLFVIKTHFNQLQTAIYFCIQIRMSMYGYYWFSAIDLENVENMTTIFY